MAVEVGLDVAVGMGVSEAVGGTGVCVGAGAMAVVVAGIGVADGGTGVIAGGMCVAVGGTDIPVGRASVAVGLPDPQPVATTKSVSTVKTRNSCLDIKAPNVIPKDINPYRLRA